MTAPAELIARFEANADMIVRVFGGIPEDRLREERVPGKWSAHANLAHLGQFHDVIHARFHRMLHEDAPTFARMVPHEHPDTQVWIDKPSAVMLADFTARRRELCAWLRVLTPEQWDRQGTHAAFGTMTMTQWLEFYLQHEGHHVYTALVRART